MAALVQPSPAVVTIPTSVVNRRFESNEKQNQGTIHMQAKGCSTSFNLTSSRGEITWSFDSIPDWSELCPCQLGLKVSEGLFIVASVALVTSNKCSPLLASSDTLLTVLDESYNYLTDLCCEAGPYFHTIYSRSNQIYFQVPYCSLYRSEFIIRFYTTAIYTQNILISVLPAPSFGYVMTPGFDGTTYISGNLDASHILTVPSDFDVVMISFYRLHLSKQTPCLSFLEIFLMNNQSFFSKVWKGCNQVNLSTEVYLTRAIKLHVSVPLISNTGLGFFMLFTFHTKYLAPQKLESGLFNCSVDNYADFRLHLDCNMESECLEGQDETGNCSFSSQACAGKLVSGSKCLSAVMVEVKDSIESLNEECVKKGGNMVVIHTQDELDDVSNLLNFGKNGDRCWSYGLGMVYRDLSMPFFYKQMWTGIDKSVLYDVLMYHDKELSNVQQAFSDNARCQVYHPHTLGNLKEQECAFAVRTVCGTVCEFRTKSQLNKKTSKDSDYPVLRRSLDLLFNKSHHPEFVVCPSRHITHFFLSCDLQSACWKLHFGTACNISITNQPWKHAVVARASSVPHFLCNNGVQSVPFTLVCDFLDDCQDRSDEVFCQHSECPELHCMNGQCYMFTSYCNQISDCLDKSDEAECGLQVESKVIVNTAPLNNVLINLDGSGYFTSTPVSDTDTCPDTHYLCPGKAHICLPVYTRCNGYYDCIGHEDEEVCENVLCPGYFRCRNSTLCVHVDHVCDGWAQCPQGDDEWLCREKPCPGGCLCHGLSFECSGSFFADLFQDLRYLDGAGSGMTPANLTSNHYLVHLVLARCGLEHVSEIKLPNLKHLDLSDNKISAIALNIFLLLKNLQFLSLSGNPLLYVFTDERPLRQRYLRSIDLSKTEMKVFSSKPFSLFLSLQFVNLSYSSIIVIDGDGFKYIPTLLELDMSGVNLRLFPADVFHWVSDLQKITANTYKLCCKTILPSHFEHIFCSAPQDELSSCEDLLRFGSYRCFLWLVSVLAIFGNLFCLVFRSIVEIKNKKNAFNIFVTCLSMADLVMGAYVSIIGAADLAFRGRYLHYDLEWMNSVVCTMAGILSLLSCETSALTILLITLDRFIVLHFPFKRLQFHRGSSLVACLVIWILGFLFAIYPVLPFNSHWEFYRQTGICIPLPITRQGFKGKDYAFGVLIILNFVLFAMIAIGQALVYWSVLKNSMTGLESRRRSRDSAVARRLMAVAVTNFLCWFPIGLCGLLAAAGTTISGEANVAMAIFVLPLNSASNPFIYTFNLVLERRRRATQSKFIKRMESTLRNDLLGDS